MQRGWYKTIKWIATTFFGYPLSAFAAQTSFFLIISAFPFAMLLLSLMRFLPCVEIGDLQSELCRLTPDVLDPFINKIFNEITTKGNVALVSVAAFSALFAASKGFFSLIRGLNMVCHIQERRRYLTVRLMSILCTGGMMIAILLTLIALVFGDRILGQVIQRLPFLARTAIVINSFRTILVFALLTFLFLLLYRWAPNRPSSFRNEWPGAMFTAFGWMVFSLLYSIYVHRVNTYIYGSLAGAVLIMLWLYFCVYLIFVGAQLNQVLHAVRSHHS